VQNVSPAYCDSGASTLACHDGEGDGLSTNDKLEGKSQMKIPFVGLMLAGTVVIAACNQLSLPSKAPAFEQIQAGKTTRIEILAALGQPDHRSLYNLGGFEIESLKYEDSRNSYQIVIAATPFTKPTVISKQLVPKKEPAR